MFIPQVERLNDRLVPATIKLDITGTLLILGNSGSDIVDIERDESGSVITRQLKPNWDKIEDLTQIHDIQNWGTNVRFIRFFGNAGDDSCWNGTDISSYQDGGSGMDFLIGGSNSDTLIGAGAADALDGMAGNDLLIGSSGDDEISGGLGDDVLKGQGGNDLLLGNEGRDIIYAGLGQNWVEGGEGLDKIYLSGGFNLVWDLNKPIGKNQGVWFREET